jgi:hypothetical protein
MVLYGVDKDDSLIMGLLERGADPNRPSPWVTFTAIVSISNSVPLVRKLVDSGLRLNEVYEADCSKGAVTHGPSTLLDHLDGIRIYISPKRKKVNALAEKYAGGLGPRRRFIDEIIAMLEGEGAKRAEQLRQQ